jgi:hypothetical protein
MGSLGAQTAIVVSLDSDFMHIVADRYWQRRVTTCRFETRVVAVAIRCVKVILGAEHFIVWAVDESE